MSELKATTVYDAYWTANSVGEGTSIQVYLKSEADKVIAEKDAEIAELKDKVREQTSIAEEGWKEFGIYHTSYAEAVKELYDKNKEIAELKADYKEACDRLQTANLIKDEQLAATRHNKYKRCLAMAEMLEHICPITIRKAKWKGKWHMRWLELAEKFKEEK